MTGSVRAGCASSWDVNNAFFQSISHKVLTHKLVKYVLGNCTGRWVLLGQDTNLKHHQEISFKHKDYVRTVKHCCRLLKEVVEILSNLYLVTLLWEKGLNEVTSRGPFQPH